MADYGTMQARIADETMRPDLLVAVSPQTTTPIQNAIQSAIARYQRERFYFSEKQSTWNTVANQEYYSTADGVPSDIIEWDALSITVSGRSFLMNLRDFLYIEDVQTNSNFTGIPFDYAYYAQKFRLYPKPNAVFPLTLSYFFRVAAPVASTDTTSWMTDAEALIRTAAKKEVYGYLMDPTNYALMRDIESMELEALRSETTERLSTGSVRPTQF